MKATVAPGPGAAQGTLTVTLDAEQPQPLRIDWGDGTTQVLPSGTLTATHNYAKDGFYKVVVQGNDVRVTGTVRSGSPAFPAWNQDKIRERREAAADEIKGIGATKGIVG